MLKKVVIFLLSGFLILMWSVGLSGCLKSGREGDAPVLIKVGDRMVTVGDYKQAFAMAVASYPLQVLKDRTYIKGLRARVLNELIDESVILSRADELGLSITDEEVEAVISEIKSDYPDDSFDKMLLEQSISIRKWRAALKKRLLMEKVIKRDIIPDDGMALLQGPLLNELLKEELESVAENKINPQDQETRQTSSLESAVPERINTGSKQPKDAYSAWITELRNKYPIYIDEALWNKIKQGQPPQRPNRSGHLNDS